MERNSVSSLGPKLFFSGLMHFTLALRTGMPVPDSDMLAATLQTKPADLASVRGCHVCNDTAHHNVLDALAVGTRHGTDLLAEESSGWNKNT